MITMIILASVPMWILMVYAYYIRIAHKELGDYAE